MRFIVAMMMLLISLHGAILAKGFNDHDLKFFYDLRYLVNVSAITEKEMDKAIFYLEKYRENDLCPMNEACVDLSPIIMRIVNEEKIIDIIDDVFPEISEARARIGREIREAIERHGDRASHEARARMERNMGHDRKTPEPSHDSSRLGERHRRA